MTFEPDWLLVLEVECVLGRDVEVVFEAEEDA